MEQSISFFAPIAGNLIRYFLFAGSAFLVFYILFPKQFSKNRIQAKLASNKDFIREILHSLQTSVIIGLTIAAFFFTPIREYTQIYSNIADFPIWWIPVSVFLALVVHDTYFYWMHRAVHHPTLYKTIHLMHHKSVNPSPWTSYSFHFFEGISEAMIAPIIIFLLPMHPIALGLFGFASFLINVYGHLGFEIMPKWFRHSFLFEVVNTSVHHNIHHEKFQGNYGLYFRVWDRIMGTEHPDYIKEYDIIQERRFGAKTSTSQIVASPSQSLPIIIGAKREPQPAVTTWDAPIKKHASTPKKVVYPMILLLTLGTLSAIGQNNIEGKWKNQEHGATVEIFEKDGRFFGQLISTENPIDNEKIQGREILLLNDFKKSSDFEYCCGTMFLPKRKKTIAGTLTLVDSETLIAKGHYGPFSGTKTWTKVRPFD